MVDKVVPGERVEALRLAGEVGGGDGDQLPFPGRSRERRAPARGASGDARVAADQLAGQRPGTSSGHDSSVVGWRRCADTALTPARPDRTPYGRRVLTVAVLGPAEVRRDGVQVPSPRAGRQSCWSGWPSMPVWSGPNG